MHAARPAFRAASLVALLMVVLAAAAASAQGFAPTPLPTRPAKAPSPAQNFLGGWRSVSDTSKLMSISARGGSMVLVVARDQFEATGFATANEVVALTRTPAWSGDMNASFETGVLRLERLDPTTLRARFSADLHAAATREETWTLLSGPPARASAEPGRASGRPDALPALGEYVYVEELPEAVEKVMPVYPAPARVSGVEGTVMVQALVGADGLVKDTRVVKSVPGLDDAAVTCVRQWRFKPGLSKGAPVAVWVAVPIKFSLH